MVQTITIQITTIIIVKTKTAKKSPNQRNLAKKVEKIAVGVEAEIEVANIRRDQGHGRVPKSQSEVNRKRKKKKRKKTKTRNGTAVVKVVKGDVDAAQDQNRVLDREVVQDVEIVREATQEAEEIAADTHDQDHR